MQSQNRKNMFKKITACLFGALLCGTMTVAAQAVIKFETTTHDYGNFTEDQPQTYVFKFKNTGDKPLVIHQAFASCGCTVPTFSKEAIAPGKTGEVKVVYNGKGKIPGKFKKTVSVRSNATNALVRVYIEGNMVEKK